MKWALALELVGFIGVGFLAGSVLDQMWGNQGVFQAGGVILAFLLWAFVIWKKLRS